MVTPRTPSDDVSSVASSRRRLLLGFLISSACLALALRDITLGKVFDVLLTADLWLTSLALMASLMVYVVTAVRWQFLFPPLQRPLLRHLFGALMLAQLVNSVLPARPGAFARAYILRQRDGLGATFVLSTVFVEKLLEGITLVPLLLVLPLFGPWPEWLKGAAMLSETLIVVGLIGLSITWIFRRRLIELLNQFAHRLPSSISAWLVETMRSILEGWNRWSRAGVGWAVLFWSVAVWGMTIIFNYLVFLALGVSVPFSAALWLLVILQLGGRLPSAPAGIGVFHYLTVMTLGLFTVDPSTALGYGILLHALIYLPASVLGAFYLWYKSDSLAAMLTVGHEA